MTSRDGPDLTSLEVRLKSLNYIGDFLLQELERFYDARPVMERYLSGEAECHHHWQTEVGGLCAVSRLDSDRPDEGQSPMLVGVGKAAKCLNPITAHTRLETLDRCLMFAGQATPFLTREEIAPLLFRMFDRKVRVILRLSAVEIDKLISEIVEGRSEIVDRLPDQDGEDGASLDAGRRYVEQSGVVLADGDCRVRWKEGGTGAFQRNDVIFCPLHSRKGIIQSWGPAIGI